MRKFALTAAAAALLALPAAVSAQGPSNSGTMTVTANVLAPLDVTVPQSLLFDGVLPGVAQTIASSDVANAGIFSITGAGNAVVTLDFGTLPGVLTDGTNDITVTGWEAGYGATAGNQDVGFTAADGVSTSLSSGQLFVFLGGSIDPAVNLPAGSYSAGWAMASLR